MIVGTVTGGGRPSRELADAGCRKGEKARKLLCLVQVLHSMNYMYNRQLQIVLLRVIETQLVLGLLASVLQSFFGVLSRMGDCSGAANDEPGSLLTWRDA